MYNPERYKNEQTLHRGEWSPLKELRKSPSCKAP